MSEERHPLDSDRWRYAESKSMTLLWLRTKNQLLTDIANRIKPEDPNNEEDMNLFLDVLSVYGAMDSAIDMRSNYNKITDNVFSLNSCGIRIKGSRYNELNRNIFQGNQKGVYFCCGAQQNIIYDNVFINNSLWHAQDTVGDNYWNYEESGNYWDDYNLSEEKPYIIAYKGQDNYPKVNLLDIEWYNSFS